MTFTNLVRYRALVGLDAALGLRTGAVYLTPVQDYPPVSTKTKHDVVIDA